MSFFSEIPLMASLKTLCPDPLSELFKNEVTKRNQETKAQENFL